ncbi:hypothetical protein ACGF3G_00580 [Streptomyces sp. NPDC048179]|uniref:hypothetical protein n=1 Tax=Streptomyces sp. NPDC048179 TaxID=3365506 RepID=UPI00371175AA
MTEQTTAAPAPDDAVTAALPPLPPLADEGYGWMESLTGTGWYPLVGFLGRMIGDWPHVCVAFHTDRENGRYGLAVYSEGTVTVDGYADEADRTKAAEAYCED